MQQKSHPVRIDWKSSRTLCLVWRVWLSSFPSQLARFESRKDCPRESFEVSYCVRIGRDGAWSCSLSQTGWWSWSPVSKDCQAHEQETGHGGAPSHTREAQQCAFQRERGGRGRGRGGWRWSLQIRKPKSRGRGPKVQYVTVKNVQVVFGRSLAGKGSFTQAALVTSEDVGTKYRKGSACRVAQADSWLFARWVCVCAHRQGIQIQDLAGGCVWRTPRLWPTTSKKQLQFRPFQR